MMTTYSTYQTQNEKRVWRLRSGHHVFVMKRHAWLAVGPDAVRNDDLHSALSHASLCKYFQVTKGPIPHYIGAGMAFICGNIYAYLASVLSRASFRAAKSMFSYPKVVVAIRFFLAVTMTISMVTCKLMQEFLLREGGRLSQNAARPTIKRLRAQSSNGLSLQPWNSTLPSPFCFTTVTSSKFIGSNSSGMGHMETP